MMSVLRFSLTIIIVVCFAVPAISAHRIEKGDFTLTVWEERFKVLQIAVLTELAAEREKRTRLEDRLHSSQNGLSYVKQRRLELEDQLAKLKGELKDQQDLLPREVENVTLSCCVHNIKVLLRHARVIGGGGEGSGVNQFYYPSDVAVSPTGGRFYVADSNNHRVKIYTDDGAIIKTFGTRGQRDGQFNLPTGLAVNSHEHVIIVDRMNHRIVVCDRDGQFKYTFGTEGSNTGQFKRPWGVAVDMSDNMYICDKANDRIQMFTRTGQFIRQFARRSAPGELSRPAYVTVAMTTGRVYVTEAGNNRVSVFTAEGDFLFTFGTHGEANGEMRHPRGIDIDEHGFVILCDAFNHRIQVFDADGRFISTFGSEGVNNGQFYLPYGLAIMQNGDVIVTDWGNDRIQIVSK